MHVWSTTKITLDSDKHETGRFLAREFTMDARGNVLDETEYDEEGNVSLRRVYRYFPDGGINQYVEYDPLDELIERHTFETDEEGEVYRVVYEHGAHHKTVKEYQYPDIGAADSATIYDESGAVIGYESFILDDNDQIIEEIEMDANRKETVRYNRKFDGDNLLEANKFVDGKLTETITLVYNEAGRVAQKTSRDHNRGSTLVDHFEYDDAGNQTRHVTLQNDFLIFENKCVYDDDNRLVLEEVMEFDFWEKRIIRHERLVHELR